MMAFDAPTRQECVARRTVTNTPAQALALLNDPQFVEAARVMAARVMDLPEEERLENLFQRVLQRSPSVQEAEEITKVYQAMRAQFSEDPKQAEDLLKIGQAPQSTHPKIDLAAWTATCRVMLNLHEFLTRS